MSGIHCIPHGDFSRLSLSRRRGDDLLTVHPLGCTGDAAAALTEFVTGFSNCDQARNEGVEQEGAQPSKEGFFLSSQLDVFSWLAAARHSVDLWAEEHMRCELQKKLEFLLVLGGQRPPNTGPKLHHSSL